MLIFQSFLVVIRQRSLLTSWKGTVMCFALFDSADFLIFEVYEKTYRR